jgi:hypothetical protein
MSHVGVELIVDAVAAIARVLPRLSAVESHTGFHENVRKSVLEEAVPARARFVSGKRGAPDDMSDPGCTVKECRATGASEPIGATGERCEEAHSQRSGEVFRPNPQRRVMQPC